MANLSERQHIERVLAVATHDSGLSQDSSAYDLIKRSWSRCVHDYGLDPAARRHARILTAHELRDHREQAEDFLHVARAGMEQLYKRVSSLGYVLLLTDAQGVTIDYIGNDALETDLKKAGLYLGADWNEEHAGTCAVGTCIVEQAPLTCHREDHFDATHITLSCNSAPLFQPDGEFMGVLDVSMLASPQARESQHLALHLTLLYAQLIEDANFLRHFANRWILRLGTAAALVDVCGELMLAFDADGVVVGANSGARQRLGRMQANDAGGGLIGHLLTDIFRCSMDDIRQLARTPALGDAALLATFDHDLFHASVIPPRIAPRPAVSATARESVPLPACPALDRLAGDDRQMQRILEQSKRLVNKGVNILIHGETGTGKEVFAKALHESSERAARPFIAVNCAAIPDSLIESELFGYAPGTFTGARSKGMKGLIQQSDRGTLFLDEIGDMPLHLQTRLLRVLSEREVLPLGADKPVRVELTVIAASHRDLRKLIAGGQFREDLYYRLCGATLFLPPLRERQDKRYLIERLFAEEAAQSGQSPVLAEAALACLMDYPWPGNVRQLRNVLRFALALSDGGSVELGDLPHELMEGRPPLEETLTPPKAEREESLPAALDEAGLLLAALRRNKWNVTAAAAELGICRATVYRHMKKFSIVSPLDL
ncbi:sigma-54-dependent Fis family transcriptional regulator [Pseudogulbenkiania ferrooxidans]|uniref:Sigma54 specific transcriptional regulator, Fis family n=1 Tax=Pseudogulbenkiania ferrooxidans 2002 TaxID=279714 RepID=B9Z004_9NEIS|nr:sigma-54-dependent Fis family transcriptional regulator [Pseudogulbenkiania ferrooxidans]EEG09887.1 sigma54 specific transcriptional regulator, Fis family [Pseudogulbenkiania ferrooxidans 2002]